MHISTPSRYPLATSGTLERCHASVVDQAPTWPDINTRLSQSYPTNCISMRVFSTWYPHATCISRPHRDTHSPRLARWKGVMLVWWTKHQLGPISTRDCPNHTPQTASRCEFSPLGTHMPHAYLDPIEIPTRHVWHVGKVSC